MQKKIKIFVSNRIDLDAASFDSTILEPVRCGAVYDVRVRRKSPIRGQLN